MWDIKQIITLKCRQCDKLSLSRWSDVNAIFLAVPARKIATSNHLEIDSSSHHRILRWLFAYYYLELHLIYVKIIQSWNARLSWIWGKVGSEIPPNCSIDKITCIILQFVWSLGGRKYMQIYYKIKKLEFWRIIFF